MLANRIGTALAICLLGMLALILPGCGGGSSSSTPSLSGKAAMRAVTISGYQTQIAATKYVLPLLADTAPTGSALAGLQRSMPLRSGTKGRAEIAVVFDSDLNLYTETSTSGATITISFFTDAAATTSAGFAKATIEGASSFDTNYATYPVTVDISANVTAGNLIASGTGKIVFSGNSGANTLTGNITAPAKGIQASLNMTLDISGNVGGSLTVVQNGLTAVVTGLTGTMSNGFSGSAAVTPGNLTGTATIDLLQGTYELVLNGPNSLSSTATVDASQNLNIAYSDGTSLTLTGALSQPPTGTATNTSGGGTTTSAYTIAAIQGTPWTILAVSPGGKMVGEVGAVNARDFNYWSSTTAAPQPITLDSSLTGITITGVNDSGHIVGFGTDSTTNAPVALYWSAFNQAPIRLATPAITDLSGVEVSVFIQSSDRIVVTYPTFLTPNAVSYVYSGPSDTNPYLVQNGSVTGLSDGTAAIGADANGVPVVWPVLSATATPIPIPEPTSTSIKVTQIGADGTVTVDDLGTLLIWVSTGPSYTSRVALQQPTGNPGISSFGIGPTGQILGTVHVSNSSLNFEGAIWSTPTSAPVILRTTDTPSVLGAYFETSSGQLIVQVIDDPTIPTYSFSVMTPK